MDTVAAFADSFVKAATALETGQSDAINRAALRAKRTIENERNRAVGADGRLSGVGKRGAKLGVRYTVKDGAQPTARVRATGPWQLIERDTKPAGVIRPKRNNPRSRRRTGPKALAGGGFGPYSKIVDKGTRGKQPFAKGAAKAAPQITRDMRATLTKAVARAF